MKSVGRIESDLRLLQGNKYQLVIRIARQSLVDNPNKLFDGIFDFFCRYSSGRKTAVVDFHFTTLVTKKMS